MGHIELAAPVVHIWYLRGTRSWLAYLLTGTEPKDELKAKQLEKVIYFAANLVWFVDDEKRHDELPNLEVELQGEKEAIEKDRDKEVAERLEELEGEIAELEKEGAKANDVKSRRRAADKDLEEIRERYEEEADLVQRAFDEFSEPLPPQDHRGRDPLAGDGRPLRRLLRRRHGRRRHRPAHRADRLRLRGGDAPRRQIDPPEGQKPLSAQRKQKAIKRLKIVSAFNRRDEHKPPHQRPAGHDPRRRPGDPAGAAPDGPARRWPLRHLRPERPVPPGHQPEQPPQATARPRRPRDHRQQREADAAGGRRRPVRQRPPRPPGHGPRQPPAQVPVRHAQGQAGPLPPEPAGQAGRLLRPFGHRGRSRRCTCTSAACRSSWPWSCSSPSS